MDIEKNAVLLVIDVQKGMDDPRLGQRNNPGAEKNIERLLQAWRASGRPIIHVRHDSTGANSPFRPGQPGNEVKPEAQPLPGEPVVRKCVSSAFIGTDLEQRLRAAQQKTLVVVGMMAEYCVNTTARMAENLGFDVLVVADATFAWEHKNFDGSHLGADEVYRAVMATLHDEFGQVVTTDAVLAATRALSPSLRSASPSIFREGVVGIAVQPAFARLGRRDDRMLRRVRVLAGMPVGRTVAATRPPALLAGAQVDPLRAYLYKGLPRKLGSASGE